MSGAAANFDHAFAFNKTYSVTGDAGENGASFKVDFTGQFTIIWSLLHPETHIAFLDPKGRASLSMVC